MFATNPRFRIYSTLGLYSNLVRSAFSGSKRADKLETLISELRNYFGSKHCSLVPQARMGIFLAIKSVIDKTGKDEIVLSPYTIADVINMVVCAGGKPVFCDIEQTTCNISVLEAEKLIGERTAAVMITHLHGIPADVNGFVDLCKERDVVLIEDAAQAFGCRIGGKAIGTFGDIGVFSFGRYKNITSFYGGCVVSDNEEFATAIQKDLDSYPPMEKKRVIKRALGCLFKDVLTLPGLFHVFTFPVIWFAKKRNIRFILKKIETELDTSLKIALPKAYREAYLPVQAECVLRGLGDVDGNSKARIRHAALYHRELNLGEGVVKPPFVDDGSHIYTCYPFQFEFRQELVDHLVNEGCDVAVQHIKNCADLESFRNWYRDCPNARRTASSTVMLPTYPSFGENNVRKVCRVINEFVQNYPY